MSAETKNLTPEQKYEELKPNLDQISECKIPDIPIQNFLQESEEINVTAQEDAELLIARGLKPELLQSFPIRIDVCRYLQGVWFNDKKEITIAKEQWKEEAPEAFKLRDLLVDEFDFALYQKPEIVSLLKEIKEGSSGSDMVQDLTNLGQMGKNNISALQTTNFDIALLDKAIVTSDRMGSLLAIYNGHRNESHPSKILRDKAYTYLKEVYDEVRRVGRFVFRNNPERQQKYQLQYKNEYR